MQRRITPDDDVIELSKPEVRSIERGLEALRVLCRLAPQDGDTVGRAVQSVEAVLSAIVDGVYREPADADE